MRNASSTSSRRTFLRRAAGTVGLSFIPASMAGLLSACTDAALVEPELAFGGKALAKAGIGRGGYGELTQSNGILALPEGFQMRSFGTVGDRMSDGNLTPIALDGMGAFPAGPGNSRMRLLRNHEDRNGPSGRPLGGPSYDPVAGGGVTTLEVGADRELIRDFVSLSGTTVNCAGGPTPWGSWLSCEETVAGTTEGYTKPHGFVFEVPSQADGPAEPVPLIAMGRFSHEAVAVDPATGIVYLTEDHGYSEGNPYRPGSGFYRFLPHDTSGRYGSLQAGGRLQMAKVKGQPNMLLFRGSSAGIDIGDTFEVEWVDIADPNPYPGDEAPERERRIAVFAQGAAQGAAAFSRLEGCWYGEGSIFFNDTSGGAANIGQVWQYVPSQEMLILVFESPGSEVLDSPDNITVSPRGGLVLCEDGRGTQYVRGLTQNGSIFDIARNNLNNSEFAGACFSPDGQTLFVNIMGPTRGTPESAQGQGTTVAIWGPWGQGAV